LFAVLFRVVNLSALQTVRIIDVEGFPLRVEVDGAQATFAVSVARGLGPAEGQVYLRADGGRVHVGDTGVEVTHGAERLVDVAGVNGRREPVRNAVGDVDGLLEVLAWNHAHHGTEDFFLSNAHVRVNVSEHSWFEEPT